MKGLLACGVHHRVPGVDVLEPRAHPWVKLASGTTRTRLPQMKILHKTIANDQEHMLDMPGYGLRYGGAEDTIKYWLNRKDQAGLPDPASGTQLITGHSGTTICTEDIATFLSYHCHTANARSWGHEIKEIPGGGVHITAMRSAAIITAFDTSLMGVQQQCPKFYKKNQPNPRFANGGVDMIGVFGHRDLTDARGQHDPGDMIFDMLQKLHGFERFDFYANEDLYVWAKRQKRMREMGVYGGAIDGIAGLATTAGLAALGYPAGIYSRWRECAERPPALD